MFLAYVRRLPRLCRSGADLISHQTHLSVLYVPIMKFPIILYSLSIKLSSRVLFKTLIFSLNLLFKPDHSTGKCIPTLRQSMVFIPSLIILILEHAAQRARKAVSVVLKALP